MARKAKDAITKVCTRTGFTITGTADEVAEFFYRDKSTKDGFSPWSKDAERAYNKAYRAGLKGADVPRKGDADDKGVVTFDNIMSKAGVRTPRTKKVVVRRDNTRSPKAKATTKARRNARRAKANASA